MIYIVEAEIAILSPPKAAYFVLYDMYMHLSTVQVCFVTANIMKFLFSLSMYVHISQINSPSAIYKGMYKPIQCIYIQLPQDELGNLT